MREACLSWPLTLRPASSSLVAVAGAARVGGELEGRRPCARARRRRTGRRAASTGCGCVEAISIRSTPAAQPTPGGRRAAEHLGQTVVAAAAAERVLRRLQRAGLELEQRARVVVEPAHERRVDRVATGPRPAAGPGPRRSGRGPPAAGGRSAAAPCAITRCVGSCLASNARSGLRSIRSTTSSDSWSSFARRYALSSSR